MPFGKPSEGWAPLPAMARRGCWQGSLGWAAGARRAAAGYFDKLEMNREGRRRGGAGEGEGRAARGSRWMMMGAASPAGPASPGR